MRGITVPSVELVEGKRPLAKLSYTLSIETIESAMPRVSESGSMSKEIEVLQKALDSDIKTVDIRLREGEYQFGLARAVASSELELCFPNAKELVKKLFGEKKVEDPQFLAKIQTILKKMEKMGIIRILPKEKPWDLQRYALESFRFQDVEKNVVVFATETDIKKARELIHSQLKPQPTSARRSKGITTRICTLSVIVIASFAIILWTLTQPAVNLTLFIAAFCMATICSAVLGISIAQKK